MPLRQQDEVAGSSVHIPALDGLRGFAILLVLFHHSFGVSDDQYPLFTYIGLGWSGVDLFFVLSGFLITGILLDTKGDPHYFRTFYVRRVLRICPLYYASLIITAGLVNSIAIPGTDRWPISNQVWYWCYLQNWARVFERPFHSLGPVGHFWSLAVEEQFYLCWPVVIWLVPVKRLIAVCLGLFFLSLGLRYWLAAIQVPWLLVYTLTVTRLDSLSLGALLAAYLRSGYSVSWLTRWVSPVLGLAAITLVAIGLRDGGFRFWHDRCWTLKFGPSVLAVLFGSFLLVAVLRCGPHWVFYVCNHRFLRFTGKYSYCMYVVHVPVVDWIMHPLVELSTLEPGTIPAALLAFLGTFLVSAAIAMVSWRLYEQPFLRLKRYFPPAYTANRPRH